MTNHTLLPAPSWAGYMALRRAVDAENALLTAQTATALDAARRLCRPANYTTPRNPSKANDS